MNYTDEYLDGLQADLKRYASCMDAAAIIDIENRGKSDLTPLGERAFATIQAIQFARDLALTTGTEFPTIVAVANNIKANYIGACIDGNTNTDFSDYNPIFNTGGGVNRFIELLDAPNSYSGQAGTFVQVNQSESGLQFTDGSGNFILNQHAAPQNTSTFWIDGNGEVDGQFVVGGIPSNIASTAVKSSVVFVTSFASLGIHTAHASQVLVNPTVDPTGFYYGSVSQAIAGSGDHEYPIVGGSLGFVSVHGASVIDNAAAVTGGSPFFTDAGNIIVSSAFYAQTQKIPGISGPGYGFFGEGGIDLNYLAGYLGIGVAPSAYLHIQQPVAGIGLVATVSGSPTITGTLTRFLSEFNIGDHISIAETLTIQSIESDTSMTATTDATISTVIPTPAQPGIQTIEQPGSFVPGVYHYAMTWVNSDGQETNASPDVAISVSSGQVVQLEYNMPFGPTLARIYRGASSGVYTKYFETPNYQQFHDTGAAGTAGSPPDSNAALGPIVFTQEGGDILLVNGNGNINAPRLKSGTPVSGKYIALDVNNNFVLASGGTSSSGSNGLNGTSNIKLGGPLSQNTAISVSGHTLTISTNGTSFISSSNNVVFFLDGASTGESVGLFWGEVATAYNGGFFSGYQEGTSISYTQFISLSPKTSSVSIQDSSYILITEPISATGLVYDADYSANGTSNMRWIPDYGAVLAAISAGGSGITALTGDVTASGTGSVAATLATVNTNVGSFGSATSVSTFTVNGKGLITAASSTAIAIAESQVTGLVSDLAAKVPTSRTVNGNALSGNITLVLASSSFANQGTTTTVLHGNASGNPAFGAIVQGDVTNGYMDLSSTQTINGTKTFASGINVQSDIVWANTNTTNLRAGTPSGNIIVTLPSVTSTLATLAGTETLTNKTIAASSDVLGGVTMTLGSDATGDLYYRSSGGQLTRLGIGSSTNVLTVTGGLPVWGASAGFANPMTTLGDVIYGGASGVATRLAGQTTIARAFLSQTESGGTAAAPSYFDLFGTGNTFSAAQTFSASGNAISVPTGGILVSSGVVNAAGVTVPSGGVVSSTTFAVTSSTSVIAFRNQFMNTGATNWFTFGQWTNNVTNSSGLFNNVAINTIYNQTSTASGTDLLISRTETAVGSGAQLFVDYQVGGSSKFSISNKNLFSFAGVAGTAYQVPQVNSAGTAMVWSTLLSKPHNISTPTTGGTVNLTNNQYNIINPAGTLLALTVNLPSSPVNNDTVFIKYTQSITTVTYGNGTVVDGITGPAAGGVVILVYDSGTTSWY